MKSQKTRMLIMIVIIAASVVLTIIGYILLPQKLVMQVTIDGSSGTTMPKAVGLAIPLLISIIFPAMYYKNGNTKNLIGCFIGILFFILIFAFNLR